MGSLWGMGMRICKTMEPQYQVRPMQPMHPHEGRRNQLRMRAADAAHATLAPAWTVKGAGNSCAWGEEPGP